MAKLDYDAACRRLKNSPANLRCSEVCNILSNLGFIVRDAKSGGHKTYVHILISNIYGNYNCGHGKDPHVRKAYIGNILGVLENYENELREYLKNGH